MRLSFSPVAGGMGDRKEFHDVADIGVGSRGTGCSFGTAAIRLCV